ncbi:hypothetical protein Tco_1402049 [Tanacetum coccineum]
MLLDREAMYARRAWTGFEDRSATIEAHVRTLEAQVETLIAQPSSLQTQLTTTLGHIQTLEARDLEPRDEPAKAENASKKRTRTRTRTTPSTATTLITDAAIRVLIAQGVADALARRPIQRNTNLNDDGSQGSGSGITSPMRTNRECTYSDFLKCEPLNFKGTEGVVGLTQWFKRIETIFQIRNCAVENQVKFATCTLHGIALTWWNTHVKIVGHDVAYGMPWQTLMKMMTTHAQGLLKAQSLRI